MSEISERTNIISIAEMPVKEIHASMVNLNEIGSYQPLNIVLSEISSYIPSDVTSVIQSINGSLRPATDCTSIKSPNSMRILFKESFTPVLSVLESNGVSPVVARKATLLNTLNRMDFKVNANSNIKNSLRAVIEAKDLKTLNAEMKAVLKRLEANHVEIFAHNLATACAIASKNIGYVKAEIKVVQGKLEVITSNEKGSFLVSEISHDARTNQVNANTETIGVADGSCKEIIRRFNEELRRMNIKIENQKNTFTGGVCQMPYSKILNIRFKDAKQKKLERTRMLNINKQLKN